MQIETIRANVIGCLNLADICLQKGIHMTYYGTGVVCIAEAEGCWVGGCMLVMVAGLLGGCILLAAQASDKVLWLLSGRRKAGTCINSASRLRIVSAMSLHIALTIVPLCTAGCIFHYDQDKFAQGNGVGFKESDTPNFTGSYYSHTKAIVENLLKVGCGRGPGGRWLVLGWWVL
jgi:hypothetical protein